MRNAFGAFAAMMLCAVVPWWCASAAATAAAASFARKLGADYCRRERQGIARTMSQATATIASKLSAIRAQCYDIAESVTGNSTGSDFLDMLRQFGFQERASGVAL